MNFSEYLDSVENTEKEQQLLACFAKDKADFDEVIKVPIVGKLKLFGAWAALANAESISEFKQTEHYGYLKSWEFIEHDLENGGFSLYPGAVLRKKIFTIMAIVGLAILFLVWCCKRRSKNRCK